jgi:hypothetical protein
MSGLHVIPYVCSCQHQIPVRVECNHDVGEAGGNYELRELKHPVLTRCHFFNLFVARIHYHYKNILRQALPNITFLGEALM